MTRDEIIRRVASQYVTPNVPALGRVYDAMMKSFGAQSQRAFSDMTDAELSAIAYDMADPSLTNGAAARAELAKRTKQ